MNYDFKDIILSIFRVYNHDYREPSKINLEEVYQMFKKRLKEEQKQELESKQNDKI